MTWKTAAILLSTVLLAGCKTIEYVYVPVLSCPAPPTILMPELAVNRLPDKPETADGLKALMDDHLILKSTLQQCITSLEGYRKDDK